MFFERHAIPVEHEGRFRDVCFRYFMIEKPLFNLESGNCENDFYCREHWKVISKIIHDHHFDSHVTTPVSLDVHHDVDAIRAHFSIPKHSTVVVEQEQKVLTRKFCSARSSLWSSQVRVKVHPINKGPKASRDYAPTLSSSIRSTSRCCVANQAQRMLNMLRTILCRYWYHR